MTDEDELLDDVRIAHDIRRMLWDAWGEHAVPSMYGEQGYQALRVHGTDGKRYLITITEDTLSP